MWGSTAYVKLRNTGFDDVEVELDPLEADDELAEAPPELDPDEPEPPDDPDDPDELDELDELLPPPAEDPELDPPFDLEDALLFFFLVAAAASAPPPPEPPWPPEPLAPPEPCPEAEPLVLLLPAVVPPWVPPTVPSKASTWLRTVVLFALSIDPVSTT
jgi:hypothetical protein